MSSNVCSIIASFIAFGVLHMRGVLGRAGWRWLFLVEYVCLHICQTFTVLRFYSQGINHLGGWSCDFLHDATLSDTDKNMVQTKWMVYGAGGDHRCQSNP